MPEPHPEVCEQLRSWLAAYPSSKAEEAALLACEQAAEPTPDLVRAVLETHPLEMPSTRREARFACVEADSWPVTQQRLKESLAADDDVVALISLTADC